MLGKHLIKHMSSTQPVITLSSGEAELTGLAKAGATAIGIQSVAQDLGMKLTIDIHSDSSAAIGIVRRRGLGRIRHLAVTDLWLQQKVRDGGFSVHKIAGADNMADIMTKYVNRETLNKHLAAMGCRAEEGRPACAPELIQQQLVLLPKR